MKIKVIITRQENANYFNLTIGDIVEVEFEEYVAAVVGSEIGNSNIEACKAQAVAARTYALAHGVLKGEAISDSSSVAQAYRASRSNYPNAAQAARETAGIVLFYGGKAISAVYSSSNGGRTVSSEERWGSVCPYLIAQDDPWDAAAGKPKNGHGVGMSQHGAVWAGAHGITYDEILKFYYPNTEIRLLYGEQEAIIDKAREIVVARKEIENIRAQLIKIREKLI